MPAVVDLATNLPEEFTGPVTYADRWLWLALLGVVLVAAYYLAVLWLTRTRPAGDTRPRVDVPTERRQHLARIDRIEAGVRDGAVAARVGHQQLSETVRSYVEAVGPLPASRMSLADFRSRAPRTLTDAIELMYPPEFAPDGTGAARERFADAVIRSRRLVATWS